MKTIKPFVIVAVTDRIVESKDADAKYRTEAEIRGMLTLKLSTGEELHPVDPSAFDPRTTESIQTLGRAAADVPDIVSSNMFFFMFKSGKPSSTQVCDPSQEGHVSVLLGKRHFGWRLPLSSVLFERTCPSCHESVNGAFRFCPWDGTNLVAPNKK
jgi:hypothetical protein